MPRLSEPTLAQLGEAALIARIARRAGRTPGRDWPLGIGDDAAILRPRAGEEIVLSTDAQIEDVHFRFGREAPRTIGRRAFVASLSDLAAMGAAPVGVLLNLAAPETTSVKVFDGVIEGFVAEAKRYHCPLVGGNLARAGAWSLDMTVIGRCRRGRALRRRGLAVGDGLFVTGTLGGAALARLRADRQEGRLTRIPVPRVEAGQALAKESGTRACLDLSDGLATDLPHLLAADGLGAQIDWDRLPRPRGFDRACLGLGLDPMSVLTEGGEDFELLFAFRSRRIRGVAESLERRLGLPVTRIGVVRGEPGIEGLPSSGAEHHFSPREG